MISYRIGSDVIKPKTYRSGRSGSALRDTFAASRPCFLFLLVNSGTNTVVIMMVIIFDLIGPLGCLGRLGCFGRLGLIDFFTYFDEITSGSTGAAIFLSAHLRVALFLREGDRIHSALTQIRRFVSYEAKHHPFPASRSAGFRTLVKFEKEFIAILKDSFLLSKFLFLFPSRILSGNG